MSLSAYRPGSGAIHSLVELVRSTLNFDPLVFVNSGLIVIGLITSLRSAGNVLYNYAEKTCLSTVHVRAEDPLYEDIVRWMNDHAFRRRNFLSVLAQTTHNSDNDKALIRSPLGQLDSDKLVSYREVEDSSIELKPFHGSRFFRFKRTWMLFSHAASSPDSSTRPPQVDSNPPLKLQCISLSLSPMKKFLEEVRAYGRKVSVSSITVYRTRPNSRDLVRWSSVASRPSRDISTVILDKQKKQTILRDINEYLHPHTRQWYANHGIPYRRGYLFSGPPALAKKPVMNMKFIDSVSKELHNNYEPLKEIVIQGTRTDQYIPSIAVTLEYLKYEGGMILPTKFMEAQMDYFGAHSYNKPGIPGEDPGPVKKGPHHYEWKPA